MTVYKIENQLAGKLFCWILKLHVHKQTKKILSNYTVIRKLNNREFAKKKPFKVYRNVSLHAERLQNFFCPQLSCRQIKIALGIIIAKLYHCLAENTGTATGEVTVLQRKKR